MFYPATFLRLRGFLYIRGMAKPKTKNILLEAKTCKGVLQKYFTPAGAERLLKHPLNGGWALPENSPWEMTQRYGIIKRGSI